MTHTPASPATLAGINPHTADMMRHALGYTSDLTKPGGYRNHYVTGDAGARSAEWEALCTVGLAQRGRAINDGRNNVYCVTDTGKALIEADYASRREAHGMRLFRVYAPDDPGAERWVWARSAGAARMGVARDWVDVGADMREALLALRVRVAEPRRRVTP